MKSLFASPLSALAAGALFLAAALIPVNAATLTWDTVSGDSTTITATSGTWSTTATNWNNAGTNEGWSQTSATAATNAAIFGGEDGTYSVTLSGTTNAQSVAFNNSGYTLTSGTLTLKPTSATSGTITVAAGKTATINSILSYTQNLFADVTVGAGGTLNLGGGIAGPGTANPNFNFSGDGTINLSNGTFTNNSSTSRTATYGNAVINLTSGTHAITPGNNAGANISGTTRNVTYNLSGGTLTLNGSGTSPTVANAHLGIGNTTGTAFTSTLNVSSGTMNVGTTASTSGEIQIAKTGSSNGTLNISGGAVSIGTGSTNNKIYFFKAGANEGYTANLTQSGGTVTANGIQFGGTAGTYSGTSSANLTLSGGSLYVGLQGITSGSAASSLPVAIKLQGGTIGASDTWSSSLNMKLGATGGGPVFQAATSDGTSKNITLLGVLSDDASVNGKLTKTGAGTLTLQGNNTFSGGVTIKNGTLESKTTQTTLGTGTVTMGGAGSSGATYITGQNSSNPFVINAPDSGSVIIGANGVGSGFTLSGGVTLNGNLTLQTFDNPVSESNKATSILTGGVTGTGNLLLNNLGLAANTISLTTAAVNHTGTITLSGTAATGDTTISAPIGSNVTGITQSSTTSRLVLSGSNTYACDLTINAGTVLISNNSNTANDVSTVTIASGGNLDLNYSGTDTVKKLVINGVEQPTGIYGPSATNIAQITGTGTLTVGAPEIAVEQPANTAIASGGSQDFGSVKVGSNTELTFTIRNSGQFALNLTGAPLVAISGPADFTVTADPTTPIAAGDTTTFTVSFAPSVAGDRAATLTIANNDSDEGSYVINLTGTGTQPSAPEIAVQQPPGTNINSGGTNNFGEVLLHEGAISRTFTIRNTGDIDLNMNGNPDLIVIGGTDAADFKVTAGPASSIITPGGNATFTVDFEPSAAGLRSATLTIPNNDSDEPSFVINLSGTGTTAPEIAVEQAGGSGIPNNSGPQDFGTVVVGSDKSLTFTVRNIGSAVLNLSGATIGGTNANEFSVTATPSSTVAVDGTTTFTVKFAPFLKGNRSAFVSIANNDSDEAPFVINLSGAAILPPEIAIEQPANTGIASGGSKDFGTVGIGFSNSLTFTIRNTGEADLNLTGTPRVAISGAHKDEFTVTPQPSASIAGAGTTTFEVKFAPTAVGSRSAALTIANNDSNEGSYVINLTGTSLLPPDIAVEQPANTGIASGGSKDFGTVAWGSSKSLTFTVRNTGLAGLFLSSLPRVIVGGTHSADFLVTASPSSYVAPGGSTTFTVQFNPRAAGTRNATLTIANNDFGDESPYVINLTGTGDGGPQIAVEQPAANVIPTGGTSDFGTVMRNSSKSLTFTVRNSGTGYLYLTGTPRVNVSGADAANFVVSVAPASSVAGGSSTSFTVQFAPIAKRLYNATLTIDTDANGSYVINLTGTGDSDGDPQIAVEQPAGSANVIPSGGTRDFGTVMRDSSKSLTFTVPNGGTGYLYLTGTPRVKVGGADAANFAVSVAPASSVAGGSSTAFTVQFVPSAKRVYNATLTIDTEANGSYVINLTGTGDGDPEMAIEQAGNDIAEDGAQDFGRVATSSSKSLTFTIRNTGNIGLNLTRNPALVNISGHDKDSFVVAASPATTIAAGGSTNFTVQFTPSSEAPHSASLSISNNDGDENPFVINLSGNNAAEIDVHQPLGTRIASGDTKDFGSVLLSAVENLTFTIRNIGGGSINLTGTPLVAISGTDAADFTVTTQPTAIIAANPATFTVRFAPSALGARNAQLTIANNDSDENPYVINLSGTAVDQLQYGSDHAGNYPGGTWTNGSNGGTGFGPWTIASSNGTSGFGGAFIGNPATAGITGMSSTSFGLYANPSSSGAYVNADRSLTNPLGVGDSFSFQWSINYDSGTTGNKGFNLYSGGTELINVNNAGSSVITINGTNIGFNYGTTAMTWTITRTSATNLQVDATNRDGGASYSADITISGDPDAFRFYASNMQAGDQAQPYFNNLQLTKFATVVEPMLLEFTANPFEDYMTLFSLTGDDALGAADPDGDGQSNDAEFAFGTDPSNGWSQQTSLVKEPGIIKLIYLQRDLDVTYTVKSFTDLSTPFDDGVEVTPTASNPQPAGLPDGYTQYEATLSTTSGKGFLRVKAVR